MLKLSSTDSVPLACYSDSFSFAHNQITGKISLHILIEICAKRLSRNRVDAPFCTVIIACSKGLNGIGKNKGLDS